jgi:Cu+-exporting ATPase
MEVDPQRAAGQSTYDGMTYYFCSRDCMERFEREPARYAQRAAGEAAFTGEGRIRSEGVDIIEEERIRSEGVDIIEEDRPAMTHGTDVIEGHGPDTTISGADVVER